jgi:DNA polymerase III subunit beta
MKVSLLQENLNKAVGMVSRMVAQKAQLPVLSNILLVTEGNQLKLSATNLETGMNVWLSAKVESKGRITVPARVFSELIGSLPQGMVELELEEDKLKVKCEKYKAVVNGISAEEFPEVPSIRGKKRAEGWLNIKGSLFESSVDQVVLAAGVDEARPIFTGVKVETSKTKMKMAATDGYRLSVKTIKGLKGAKEAGEMVVPARALMELSKIVSQAKTKDLEILLAVTDKDKQLILVVEEIEIVTRLLEGDYPDYAKIIPEGVGTTISFDKEELIQAVKVASIFARDSANIIKFKVEDSSLTVSANAPQVGENEVKLQVKQTGEDVEIAFNSRYLMEILAVLEGDSLSLSMSGALSPGVFRQAEDDSYLHIIMPVRVQS